MTRARLYRKGKPAGQSGRARAGQWVLEFEGTRARHPDALMGWVGGGDTVEQVRLTFPTLEAAQAYCAREGLEADVIPAPDHRLILRAYADNFR
jgi:hypothetical protein